MCVVPICYDSVQSSWLICAGRQMRHVTVDFFILQREVYMCHASVLSCSTLWLVGWGATETCTYCSDEQMWTCGGTKTIAGGKNSFLHQHIFVFFVYLAFEIPFLATGCKDELRRTACLSCISVYPHTNANFICQMAHNQIRRNDILTTRHLNRVVCRTIR